VTDENILELDESEKDDRRQFDRRPLTIEIQYEGGDARGTATTRDIGIGGLYLATDRDLREGTPLLMRLEIGGRELILNGVVTYRDPRHGVGIRFQNLSEEIENILRSELPML
jgi:hypothetical protein